MYWWILLATAAYFFFAVLVGKTIKEVQSESDLTVTQHENGDIEVK